MLFILAVVAIACRESSAPAAPRWTYGPGCTIEFMHQIGDSIWDIAVQHFDTCPRIVYDSTLVAP